MADAGSAAPSTSSVELSLEERRRRQNALMARARRLKAAAPKETAKNGDDDILIVAEKIKKNADEDDIVIVGEKKPEAANDELKRKATEALVREAKRSALRAEMFGPQGWIKPRALNTNKEFLARTLLSVEVHGRDLESAEARRSRRLDRRERDDECDRSYE